VQSIHVVSLKIKTSDNGKRHDSEQINISLIFNF